MSKKLKTLEDLFENQIKDLYSCEAQLTDAMPKMIENTSHEGLKKALERHLQETKEQRARVEQIGEKLDLNVKGEKCNAIEGIIKEAEEFMEQAGDGEVMDAGIIANGQRIEHYEMAGYGTARQYAQRLEHNAVANMLETTLKEEKNADSMLNQLALAKINERAEA